MVSDISTAAVRVLSIEGAGPGNRLTASAALALNRALCELNASNCAIAILKGGDSSFCEGFDVAEAEVNAASFADPSAVFVHRYYPADQEPLSFEVLWSTLLGWRSETPIIAAIEGPCLDVGLAILGVHSDIRIAGRSARFGFPGVLTGDTPGLAIASGLRRQMPEMLFNWMVHTGESIDAATAWRMGFVHEIVDDGAAAERARILAGEIAARGGDLRTEKHAAFAQLRAA